MIRDYLIQPLVRIEPGQLAYLLHPGSQLRPVFLNEGWAWHWPLLSTIRIVDTRPAIFIIGRIDPDEETGQSYMRCESIVCVSRDHQLFKVEGRVRLEAPSLGHDDSSVMPTFIHHSPIKFNRFIQSAVRQSLRASIAKWPARQLHNPVMSQFNQSCLQELNFILRPQDLQATSFEIERIELFNLRKAPVEPR